MEDKCDVLIRLGMIAGAAGAVALMYEHICATANNKTEKLWAITQTTITGAGIGGLLTCINPWSMPILGAGFITASIMERFQ